MKALFALMPLFLLPGCMARPALPEPRAAATMVTYPSGKETVRGLLLRPAGNGPFPAVVLIHGDYGLNEGVKSQARRLADMGYLVLAVDLYRGEAVTNLEDAHIMDRGLPEDRIARDLKGAVDYLTGRPDVIPGALGIAGWDSGGGYALDAAIRDPRLRAVVVCYGRLTTDPDLLRRLRAAVLGIFAGEDLGITPETIAQFNAAMQKAVSRGADVHTYSHSRHGFMDSPADQPPTPAETQAAADAWKRIEAFLAGELKP